MATTIPVLKTKLFIPRLRPNLLSRPRLIDMLRNGDEYQVVLVSASGGSGKTTVISEWASLNRSETAWISLDPSDNDPTQFLTYFVAAVDTIVPGFGGDTIKALGGRDAIPIETLVIDLINEAIELEDKITVVFDDFHVIENGSINDLMVFLIDHLPPGLRLCFSTRIDPPWPLARFRSRGLLFEIRGNDLRFDEHETLEYLNDIAGLGLSPEDAKALEARTEGWALGLQLALLSMQGRTDLPGYIRTFTGSQTYVAEYLLEEILGRQSEERLWFLLRTSILERMCGDLCNELCGCEDGKSRLAALQRDNVFVVALDDTGEWFRYHHLFADLLRERLGRTVSKEAVSELHRRASHWFEAHAYIPEAVEHAFASNDDMLAADLVDRVGLDLVFSEHNMLLRRWLEKLPPEVFVDRPRLEVYRLLIDLGRAVVDMHEKTLLEKEAIIRELPASPGNDRLRKEALVNLSLYYAFQNTAHAIEIADNAFESTSEDDVALRSILYSAYYRAHGMEGDIDRSTVAYRESLRLSRESGNFGMIANTTMIRAFDLCQYGRLDEAERYCREIIDIGERTDGGSFYPAGQAYIGLAGILLERNRLDDAESALEQGIDLCRRGASSGLFTGYVQKSRLLQARGGAEQSLGVLEELLRRFKRREFTLMAREVAVRLALGEREPIEKLASTLREYLGESAYSRDLPLIAAESFKLSLSRILIARDGHAEARSLLDDVISTVTPGGRRGRLMEALVLKAISIQRESGSSASEEAVAQLEPALEIAGDCGFVTLIIEDGRDLIPLLKAVVRERGPRAEAAVYARRLLDVFGVATERDTAPVVVNELVEQLTPREMEVLDRIAAGDSNQTIADSLFVSIRTVKKHTGNIFAKLRD